MALSIERSIYSHQPNFKDALSSLHLEINIHISPNFNGFVFSVPLTSPGSMRVSPD